MTPSVFLAIIIAITVVGYILDQFLDYLNLRSSRKDIPDDIAGFYDREKYHRSLEYHAELTRFSFVTSAFGFVLSMIMLLSGGFGWVNDQLSLVIRHDILRALAFFGILGLAADLLTIPFQLYSTFVIEEKYGFNKTTIRTFITDKLKGYALSAVIGGALLAVLLYLIEAIGPGFWMWFAAVASVFMLLVNMFYTSLIVPLFNKLTPITAGPLKDAIEEYSRKVSFPLDAIYVIDGSRRSSKANAFFSGIGGKKKIVLYDTLIEKHTTDELVAVLAHEVGHYKRKHIVLSYILAVLQIVFTLFVLSFLVFNPNVSIALGASGLSIPVNLVAFGILFSPISAITGLFMNMLSRRHEFEADAYARQSFSGVALSDALKKLSVENLSNLYPHPLYVFIHYSHPPLLQRLEALNRESTLHFPKMESAVS